MQSGWNIAQECVNMYSGYGDTMINLPHGEIRRPNLEDLFLDLTGHSLRA